MMKYVDICKLTIDFYLNHQFMFRHLFRICLKTTSILDSDSIENYFMTAQISSLPWWYGRFRFIKFFPSNCLILIFYQTLLSSLVFEYKHC